MKIFISRFPHLVPTLAITVALTSPAVVADKSELVIDDGETLEIVEEEEILLDEDLGIEPEMPEASGEIIEIDEGSPAEEGFDGGEVLIVEEEEAPASSAEEVIEIDEGFPAEEGIDGGEVLIVEEEEAPASSTEEVIEIDQESSADVVDEVPETPASAPDGTESGPALVEEEIELQPLAEEELVIEEAAAEDMDEAVSSEQTASKVSFRLNDVRAEYGRFVDSDSEADNQGYLFGLATIRWLPNDRWELQAAARVDGNYQWGGRRSDSTKLDYGNSFIRYSDAQWRLTLGADTVIWGRIDEIPPTDRVSVVDMTRFILDDLPDRRRAAPIIRAEGFFASSKLDLVFLPLFREAELPEEDSVWYPINRDSGEIIGVESDPRIAELVKTATYKTDAPNSDGGFGIRFSDSREGMDYALTVQNNRQSVPYFRLVPEENLIVAEYPRSWVLGGDLAFTASGATWRVEAAWFSDTPVTETNNTYTTVKSVSWGGGVEFYPGDGDARVNLQVGGMNMINPPNVIDRTDIYSFNGSMEAPFARNRWRAKARFYVGLGENDVYINPEIAYIDWEPHEVYLEAHYFNGADGTPGGFHENHSLLTLGWRAKF